MTYFTCREVSRLDHLLQEAIASRNQLAGDRMRLADAEEKIRLIEFKINFHRQTCRVCSRWRVRRQPENPTVAERTP